MKTSSIPSPSNHTADHGPTAAMSDAFAAKVFAASRGTSRCEEFNVWHAAADNVTNNGVDLEWGGLARRKREAARC